MTTQTGSPLGLALPGPEVELGKKQKTKSWDDEEPDGAE